MIRFILLTLFFAFPILAQTTVNYRYRLQGSFRTDVLTTPAPVRFVLSWNETPRGLINGVYSDNRFSPGSTVSGSNNAFGRVFRVPLSGDTAGATKL
jgi:hypothetical protein